MASDKGHSNCVETLLQHGADVNAGDKYNWTPLFIASWNGHIDVVKKLLKAGADPFIKGRWGGETALDKAQEKGHFKIAELLKIYTNSALM